MTVVREALISAATVEAYRGTFAAGEEALAETGTLPPAWEGVFFPFDAALADLRPDGTPARDGVVPEIDLPRRMYAGETTEFVRPVPMGATVTQTTRLGDVVEKSGSHGRLVFVDVVREYAVAGETAVRSVWHDVFLEQADPDAPARPPRTDHDVAQGADWVEDLVLDARQLFRFSALTFNTHLIHYDRAWARDVEGLPDLLVHGPLTRILLMDAARRNVEGRTPARLDVRAIAPVLVDRPLRVAGRTEGDRTRVTALNQDDVVLAVADIDWTRP
ncbi:MaoC family dehydratase N-terminal domain-containing protein [Microbacterium fluvii]|uniref:MaoC family dehydratase N-terminal domain-containing protein n=1 Tax=Microbacterium fluvii TaxID=415215 RepID=A0ABW2HFB4_9MICO|nr:MaoC family dehydratase N-terminal domain-containing protein [Microbacterium fluvii]MCU4672770.1 MaoC family dehydratase N-terminal domain-containing protein [Microbacterium fluvii]